MPQSYTFDGTETSARIIVTALQMHPATAGSSLSKTDDGSPIIVVPTKHGCNTIVDPGIVTIGSQSVTVEIYFELGR